MTSTTLTALAASSMANLPEELLSLIASYTLSKGDLCRLALVSRQLNRVAIEHLYHHVTIDRYHLVAHDPRRPHQVIRCLTILLLEREEVAARVQHLTIRGMMDWGYGRRHEFDDSHPTLRSAVIRIFKRTKESEIEEARWRMVDPLLVLLIHILPNLKSLDMDIAERPGAHYYWLMNQFSSSASEALRLLNDLVLSSNAYMSIKDPTIYKSYFHLPGLKRVFLFDVGQAIESELTNNTERVQQDLAYLSNVKRRRTSSNSILSTVEYLEIRNGNLNFEPLCDLICLCQALRTFMYEQDSRAFVLYPSLMPALALHTDSLQELRLLHSETDFEDYVIDSSKGVEFTELNNLKHLKIPAVLLLGVDPELERIKEQVYANVKETLPRKLQKLTFTGDHFYWSLLEEILLKLQDDKSVIFPHLKEILLQDWKWADNVWSRVRVLQTAWAQQGVRLRITRISEDGDWCERGWGMEEDICWAPITDRRNEHQRLVEYDPECLNGSSDVWPRT